MAEPPAERLDQFVDIVTSFEKRVSAALTPSTEAQLINSSLCPVCERPSKDLGQFYGARQGVCRRCKEYFRYYTVERINTTKPKNDIRYRRCLELGMVEPQTTTFTSAAPYNKPIPLPKLRGPIRSFENVPAVPPVPMPVPLPLSMPGSIPMSVSMPMPMPLPMTLPMHVPMPSPMHMGLPGNPAQMGFPMSLDHSRPPALVSKVFLISPRDYFCPDLSMNGDDISNDVNESPTPSISSPATSMGSELRTPEAVPVEPIGVGTPINEVLPSVPEQAD